MLLPALVVGAVALLWTPFVMRGWIPHDEGVLSQSASRVLAGELPHRDFAEGYTGLLSLWHATLFATFVPSIATLRWGLYVAGLGFVAVLFALFRRLATDPMAIAGTVLAALWSLPIYFSAMPSWYVVFAAVGSLWALLRSFEGRPGPWSGIAGALASIAFLCKSTGALTLAAGLIVILFEEQERAVLPPAAKEVPRRPTFAILLTLAGLVAITALCALLASDGTVMGYLHFALPPAALVAFVLGREWSRTRILIATRWQRLSARAVPFTVGAAVPLLLFFGYFAVRGGLDDALANLFGRPGLQIEYSATQLPPVWSLVAATPALCLFWVGGRLPKRARATLAVALAIALSGVLVLGDLRWIYTSVWDSLRPLVPIVTIAGLVLLLRRRPDLAAPKRPALFGALVLCAFLSLLQFPYPFGIYFAYVAPLVALCGFGIAAGIPASPRAALAVLAAFYGLFAAIWELGNSPNRRGSNYFPPPALARFELAPARGLAVPWPSKLQYETLVRVVAEHVPAGSWLWAAPDCPEVNFLTSTRNPMPTLMDFADRDFGDPLGRAERILARLNELDVRAVVLARVAAFSGPLDPGLVRRLRSRYPNQTEVGKFVVLWREPADGPNSALTADSASVPEFAPGGLGETD